MGEILLKKFNENEIMKIQNSISNKQQLMIWAGPKYSFPITNEQIVERIKNGVDIFSVYSINDKTNVGFIELEEIEKNKIGSIQSVLIYKEYRGKGYSNLMLKRIIEYGFKDKELKELRLRVFANNEPAKKCYESNGFKVIDEIIRKDEANNIEFKLYEMKLENNLL